MAGPLIAGPTPTAWAAEQLIDVDKDRPRHFAKRTRSFAAEIGALLRTTPKAARLVFIDGNRGRSGFDFENRNSRSAPDSRRAAMLRQLSLREHAERRAQLKRLL